MVVSFSAFAAVFFMAAISVVGQIPQLDAAVKLADVVDNKPLTYVLSLTAMFAMGVIVYLVRILIGLVRDSIGSASEMRKELAIIKALIRNQNVDEDDTPAR